MDRIVLQRKPIRQKFTVTYNMLQELLKEDEPNFNKIDVSLAKLERLGNDLEPLDRSMIESILDLKDEVKLGKEYEEQDEYRDKLLQARVDVEFLKSSCSAKSVISSSKSTRSSPTNSRRKLKLPELQLKQFSGDIKDWLSFWSQFKRIHEDKDMEEEDKFQYLIQTMARNSKARDIVESFPPTAQNYQKAIDVLKNRYGRDELLIEYYVRELIALVIKNTTTPKSHIKISTLYDRLEAHLRALESIGMTRDKYEAMLFPLVESCIPEDILRAWLRSPSNKSQIDRDAEDNSYSNRLQQLLLFIKGEVESEERIMMARIGLGFKNNHRPDEITSRSKAVFADNDECVPTASSLHAAEKQRKCDRPSFQKQTGQGTDTGIVMSCVFCEKPHESKDCFNAQRMNSNQKNAILTKKRACFSCLKIGHRSKDCKSNVRCIVCSKKHQTIVCPSLKNNNSENLSRTRNHLDEKDVKKPSSDLDANLSNSLTSANSRATETRQVFLQTMMVKLRNGSKEKLVRVLLDSGSQRSYIRKSTAEEMEYKPNGKEEIVHALFGGIKSSKTKHNRYEIKVFDLPGSIFCNISVLDQTVICSQLPRINYGLCCEELERRNISFTDVGNDYPEIELLIGADVWSKILTGNTVKLDSGLLAMETLLGWTIMGTLVPENRSIEQNGYSSLVTSMFVSTKNLSDLWDLDVLGIREPCESKSKEEMESAVSKHFEETVTINKEGRYEIMLPWVELQGKLKSNKDIAYNRLLNTTEKINKLNKFWVYDKVFVEWESLGIIEEVNEAKSLGEGYYLPHRPVIKEESATTKVRPVFDASNRKKGGFSLNDCLEKGPNVIELIPEILLRFREKEIGVTSDIEKAFLQIAVNKTDREYLKFLWWKNYEDKTIKEYKHCRVVFGVNCSPFLLGAVINYHLDKCTPEFQNTARKLKRSFYVDNCVTSVGSTDELNEFIEKSTKLMSFAKFNLRDWQSTSDLKPKENEKPSKILGMNWDRFKDTIYCDLGKIETPEIVTRRTMLSMVHKVFDPIGYTCPFTLLPKTLLQESWKSKIDWDAEVSEDIRRKFLRWSEELVNLVDVRIPRCIGLTKDNPIENTTIHVFCDSSKSAFATVIFLRTDNNAVVKLNLLMAKSRVCPLKALTIPRLELMSCLIGARLMKTVEKGLGESLKDVKVFYWTDSSTALFWIMKEEPWGQFVQNRVQEIRDKTGKTWQHVPGELNPADLPSRGCNIKVLIDSKWWEGPTWLKRPEDTWPKSNFTNLNSEEINVERRKKIEVLSNIEKMDDQWYLNYFSEYIKIVRMVAWITRFTRNVRKSPNERIVGELLVSEIHDAEIALLKQVQKESFDKHNLNELKSLSYFEDSDGLIRAKTKLTNRSEECDSFKYPIVLPDKHHLVQLLIMHEHVHMSHAGLNILLTKLRERFWILRGRRAVRSCINKCIVCRRHTAKNICPESSSLPADRVKDATIFERVGVDLAGPLIMRNGMKVWITVYTCAVYRAVHFELISSLSTNGFILGLRRFIARRGRPKIVYSDNGSNFVGTNNLFKGIDWSFVERQSSSIWRIQWKFNPPTAAWWGGWWERIVQMVKGILRRVLRKASVNYEEMSSILCDAEAVINSRPLTYLSDEMDDIIPLTPAMFLQESYSVNVIDLDLIDTTNFSKRFRYQQRLREDLRKRFRNEYLSNLMIHGKKPKTQFTLKEGDVILVGSDEKKRMDWPLGKIMKLFPGKDGVVRVARVKTKSGELIRPVQRLYPMEISSQEQESMGVHQEVQSKIEEEKNILEEQSQNKDDGREKVEDTKIVNAQSRSGRIIKLPPKFSDFEL